MTLSSRRIHREFLWDKEHHAGSTLSTYFYFPHFRETLQWGFQLRENLISCAWPWKCSPNFLIYQAWAVRYLAGPSFYTWRILYWLRSHRFPEISLPTSETLKLNKCGQISTHCGRRQVFLSRVSATCQRISSYNPSRRRFLLCQAFHARQPGSREEWASWEPFNYCFLESLCHKIFLCSVWLWTFNLYSASSLEV